MGMNNAELEHVIAALQREVGAPLTGAWQPARDRVLLGLPRSWILIVPRGPFARIHSVERRPRNPSRPFSFQGALRAHLTGPLTAIHKAADDRIVDLFFGVQRLHLRLTGRRGGLWLLDGDTVVAAYDGPAPEALPTLSPRPVRTDLPRFQPQPDETWDQAAARWFTDQERSDRAAQRRRQLERDLRREMDRTLRLRTNLAGDLERAARAPALRRQADALAASLHRVPRGATLYTVADLEDPDMTWNIEMLPGRPASATMERLYTRARRLDRVRDQVTLRLDQVEDRLDTLRRALTELPEARADDLKRLSALVPKRAGRGRPLDEARPFVTWTGPQGEQVLVGRNAQSNRRLTFQTARGTDWWMHLRGRPGAHVVIRARRDHPPSLELLLAAAQITLIHARVDEGSAAEVQYTRVRDVRSIPGDRAGQVRLFDEKVLHITRDASALVGWTRDG